jgi:hypothetical protein
MRSDVITTTSSVQAANEKLVGRASPRFGVQLSGDLEKAQTPGPVLAAQSVVACP